MPKKRLLRCRACRLTWFPQGGAATACPACGGKEFGGTLELFHVGIVLIALALIGWMWPLLGQSPLGERLEAAIPAAMSSTKLTAQAERSPAEGQAATFRRGEKVATLKQPDHRVVKDRRKQVNVSSKKIKRRQKAKTRSQHVQR